MSVLASQIAGWCNGRLEGSDRSVSGLEAVEMATADHLTFLGTAFYAKQLAESKAVGAIVTDGLAVKKREDQTIIWVANADLAVAQVLDKLAPPLPVPDVGVHPTAVVDSTAKLGRDVRVGPCVVIQANVVVGDRCVLMANVFVGAESVLGDDDFLWPGVVVRERCRLGQRVICHPGVVIGADGFGYRFHEGRHIKIPQIGTVEIGDDVELGANTTVDRGKFSATVVGEGSKVDNLVQIGHNVRLGRHCILVAQTAIGGSTRTGDYLITGGASSLADHLEVGNGVQLAACSALDRSAGDGERFAGTPAQPAREFFADLKNIRRLPRLLEALKELQQRVAKLESAAENH